MGHLDRAAVLAGDQQAGLHKAPQRCPAGQRHRLPARHNARVLPLLVDAAHLQEGLAQGLLFSGLQGPGGEQTIGGPLHRPGQAAEMLVVEQAEIAVAAVALPQFPQGEGKQGQGITGAGVGHHPLQQGWFQAQSGKLRRAGDHLGIGRSWHRPECEVFERDPSDGGVGLEGGQSIRAQRGDHQQPAVAIALAHHLAELGQEARRRGWIPLQGSRTCPCPSRGGDAGEQLLELVDHHHHSGLPLATAAPQTVQLALEAGQRGGWSRGGLARCLERGCQGPRELSHGIGAGAEGIQHQPGLPVAPQPRHDSGPNQRRLAAARRPQQHQQRLAAEAAQVVQPVEGLLDLAVAPEIHGRIRLLEGHQAWIGRAAAIPAETGARVETGGQQTARQCAQSAVGIAGEVDRLEAPQHLGKVTGAHLHGEQALAQVAGDPHLPLAPFGGHEVLTDEGDHRPAAAELVVQLPVPVAPRRNAALGIEIQKQRLMALLPQPGGQALRPGGIPAAVADENRAHRWLGRGVKGEWRGGRQPQRQ